MFFLIALAFAYFQLARSSVRANFGTLQMLKAIVFGDGVACPEPILEANINALIGSDIDELTHFFRNLPTDNWSESSFFNLFRSPFSACDETWIIDYGYYPIYLLQIKYQ